MALESLLSAKSLHKHPLFMLLLAMIASSIAIFIAYYTFPQASSILAIAFLTIGLVPVVEALLKHEEKKEAKHPGFAGSFLARHSRLLQVYAWFFIGIIIASAFWYVALPPEMKGKIFLEQDNALSGIQNLKSSLSGAFTGMFNAREVCAGNFMCWFEVIFINNTGVLALTLVLSLIFGAGAIFLIGWNASVIGVAIGKEIIALMVSYKSLGIMAGTAAFAHGFFNAIGLVPHGIFEAGGYFVIAIAGGIIGIVATRRKYYGHELSTILKDAALLIAIAVTMILVGALIEAQLIISAL